MCKYKLIICFLTLNLILNPCFAGVNLGLNAGINETLNKIENDIYGFNYTSDKTQNRVERLEKFIYGKPKTGDINNRINTLSADIAADVIGLEIPASKDTFLEEENLKEEENVNYPVVNDIEQKIFNKTYKNRDFHTRIVTIEKKLFGKIYDVDDYPKRLDRIKAEVYKDVEIDTSKYDDYSEYSDSGRGMLTSKGLSGINKSRFGMPFGQRKYSRPYTNYGDFNGYDNYNDNNNSLNDDLSQMEYEMFGTEFSSDDTQTRIKRLNSVNKARKSSQKYDSQKFSQHMSTAMEIGAMILMILAMVL